MKYDIPFVLLHLSFVFQLIMLVYLFKLRNKGQIHFATMSMMSSISIWTFGYLGLFYIFNFLKFNSLFFIKIIVTGIILTSVSLFFFGYIFAHTKIKFNWRFGLLLIIPTISLGMIYTNEYHQLFYKYFTVLDTTNRVWGPWFTIHAIYSYLLIFLGLWYLLYFSIKNSGFFSKQSNLIIIGVLSSLVINMLITLQIGNLPYYFEAIAFTLGVACFMFAILKFQFLNIVPVALQKVVDLISDSYIIINENFDIIDYNKTFVDTFRNIVHFKRKDNLVKTIESNPVLNIDVLKFNEYVKEAIKQRKTITIEKHIESGEFDKYFEIEITPIFSQDQHIGTIILLKDITQHKKDLELIQQTQNQLIEQERLASLGELAGGVAHDINNPVKAIDGTYYIINMLFENELNKEVISKEDIKVLFDNIKEQTHTGTMACQKVFKIVNSIRNHTRNLSGENYQEFYISSVVEDIKILYDYQLKTANCKLTYSEDDKFALMGDPVKLGQVLTNLINNAVQAYGEKSGNIDINVKKKNNAILISVTDNAGGIPEQFRDGIFNKILTTKGTEGTGLGLYFSHSIITGHFGGDMWFETEEGKGTTFYISLPIKNN